MPAGDELFVDTSGWAYLLFRNEPLHASVNAYYQTALRTGRKLVTTNYVLAELIALLTTRGQVPRPQMVAFVDALRSAPQLTIVHVDAALDAAGWALLKARSDKSWSLVDAVSFVLMSQRGIAEALTTDHHFAQARFLVRP